jgi:GntR family transcriptional regulator
MDPPDGESTAPGHRRGSRIDALDGLPRLSVPKADGEGVPLYEQMKRQISELILLGRWAPGAVLPGETQLARDFGVAVGTVRRALADLAAEGLLMRRRKTGTVVTGRSPHHSLRFFYQYFRLHRDDGTLLRSKPRILSMTHAEANAQEAEVLQLSQASPVVRIHRLRSVGQCPAMHERMVIAAHRVPSFPDAEALPELLYLFLLERYGMRISSVRESLSADLATEEDAALLSLAPPTAVLVIDEIAYDQAGTPAVAATHRATTDGFRYMNEVR